MTSLQACCIHVTSICFLLVSLSSAAHPSRAIEVSTKHPTEPSSGIWTFNRPPSPESKQSTEDSSESIWTFNRPLSPVPKQPTEETSGSRWTFNRPPGTRPVVVTNIGSHVRPGDQYGRTFGQYGSYRDHLSWRRAVLIDRQRHGFIHNKQRQPFHWLFRNLNMALAYGFDLQGFWNSYAPLVQDNTHHPRTLMLSSIEPLQTPDE